jgi:hypothetical protein
MWLPGGPRIDALVLVDALAAAGLSDAVQDAVVIALGDSSDVALAAVKGLLTGAGVGAAVALRVTRALVSGSPASRLW